ncbi:LpxL/LpxP family acyltransferase [Cysteiniphilum halobium]|uniref:LpxL/LpxP family acyltransferase n=1 Tax=Cysteiniphilum halobium TaxID=2219059 RepID=UPI003F8686C1
MHSSEKVEPQNAHWSKRLEKGSIIGLKLTLWTVKFFGRRFAYILTYPVVWYFYLSSRKSRQAINRYCQNVQAYAKARHMDISVKPLPIFINFGKSLVDKIAVWNGQITRKNLNFANRHELIERIDQKKGTIIFTAHLGTIEVMRAISNSYPNSRINALVFNQHAQKFNDALSQINPSSQLSLISISHFDMTLAMQLQQKMDQGEILIIACDRTPATHITNNRRTIKAKFLGKNAYFPQGGFLLAHLLKVPVYTMLCLKNGKQFDVIFKPFAKLIKLPRNIRDERLTDYVQQYSDFLGEYCLKYSTQWFNFFDFWLHNDE